MAKAAFSMLVGRSVLSCQRRSLTTSKNLAQKSAKELDMMGMENLPFWKRGVPRYWIASMAQHIDTENIIGNTIEDWRVNKSLQYQIFSPQVIQLLGPQKALGQVVHHIGGKFKLYGEDEWRDYTKALYKDGKPNLYPWEVKIEAIDLSGTTLMYEGVSYLKLGQNLLHLNVSNCADFNDYGVALLNTIESLVSLDLSHNQYVTERCIIPFNNLSNLRRLDLSGIEYFRNRPIALTAVEKHLPDCVIVYNPPITPEPKPDTEKEEEVQYLFSKRFL